MKQFVAKDTPYGDITVTIAGGTEAKIVTIFNDSGECLYAFNHAPETSNEECLKEAIGNFRQRNYAWRKEYHSRRANLEAALKVLEEEDARYTNTRQDLPVFVMGVLEEVQEVPTDDRTYDYLIHEAHE